MTGSKTDASHFLNNQDILAEIAPLLARAYSILKIPQHSQLHPTTTLRNEWRPILLYNHLQYHSYQIRRLVYP
ncbi:hypothetical protein [Dulcicalothrix desertica]|uniref:hypothetical protein n=1 Tax=Dulcicalothrix desertica TaxID=32056 RepID=UPI000F8E2122|nr:hypothetical protein [Dulcicalothrix desertica]